MAEESGQKTRLQQVFSVLGLVVALVMGGDFMAVMGHYVLYTRLADNAGWMLAFLGGGSLAGRLLAGWANTRPQVSPVWLTIGGLALASLSSFLYQFTLDPTGPTWTHYLAGCCLGLSTGLWIATTTPLWVLLLGKKHLEKSFGVLTFIRGFACLIGPVTDNAIDQLPFIYFATSTIILCIGGFIHMYKLTPV